jgi:hypothetical protein
MFISIAAATRLFPLVKVLKIWKLSKWQVCIRYSCKGMVCNTIVKASRFLEDAKDRRTEASKTVTVTGWGGKLSTSGRVLKPSEFYITQTGKDGERYNTYKTSCTCKDWQRQKSLGNGFGRPVCKHQIAVATSLGFLSYKDWAVA